jgi:hypothetical protein
VRKSLIPKKLDFVLSMAKAQGGSRRQGMCVRLKERESDGLWLMVIADNPAGARVGRPPPDFGVQAVVFGNVSGDCLVAVLVSVASQLSFLHVMIV